MLLARGGGGGMQWGIWISHYYKAASPSSPTTSAAQPLLLSLESCALLPGATPSDALPPPTLAGREAVATVLAPTLRRPEAGARWL